VRFLHATNVRTRLTLWYVALLAGILVVYILLVFAFQYGVLRRQIVHDEIQDVETVEGLLFFDAAGKLQLEQNYHSHPQSHLLTDRLMEVRDLSGVVLYRADTLHGMELGGASLPSEGSGSFNERIVRLDDGSHALMISHLHPIHGTQVLIRLGYSLAPLRERMMQFLLLLLVALPLTLLLAGFAGYSVAKRALRPLDTMAARAQHISASNLHDRLAIETAHDELGHMGQVFNHLLDRLEQAFAQLQRFTADAAHELRTPLAALRATGELALHDASGRENHREAISTMLEETVRLNQTIDGLLMLSKAEASYGDTTSTFFLKDVVIEILALLEVLLDERHITVEHHHDGHGLIGADRSLVRVALLNILHNAVKFSDAGSVLSIRYERIVSGGTDFEQVCIENAGPCIPAGDHERVFDRFYTGTSHSTASGAGLGLSIAKLVIERSGGQIRFDESVVTGARCFMTLPASTAMPEAC